LPILTYAAAALNFTVRQENELNARWYSVYRKLFVFINGNLLNAVFISSTG